MADSDTPAAPHNTPAVEPQVSSKQQFDRQATHYNQQWNQWNEASLLWMLERADCKPTDRLLDVATGTGFTACAFASRVGEVVGLDVSSGMLKQAEARAKSQNITNISFRQGPAEEMPFPDGDFDLVTCRVAPHHFLLLNKFIKESWRVLRPGGRLLITDTSVPDDEPEVDAWQNGVEQLRDKSHVRNYPPVEWRQVIENAGFQLEEIELLEEPNPILLESWMEKSGCRSQDAEQVRQMFRDVPTRAREIFHITRNSSGETGFQWLRVALLARKLS